MSPTGTAAASASNRETLIERCPFFWGFPQDAAFLGLSYLIKRQEPEEPAV